MARNIPQCEWIVNSTYELTNPEVTIEGNNCTVDVNGSCSDCVYTVLNDAFVYSIIVCYSIIMSVGFVGNLTVIFIILSVRELRIVINLLLVALAVSDIVITIAMPYSFLNSISYEYKGPVGICKGTPMLQGTAIMSGIYTLVVIAVERYYVIVRPFRNGIFSQPKRVLICICLIWVISACVQIPLVITLDVESFDLLGSVPSLKIVDYCTDICVKSSVQYCLETWTIESAIAFSYALLILMYVLPLICISCLYFLIGRAMWKRRPVGNATSKEVELFRQKRRLLTFLLVLVITFGVLWGPYFIMPCLRVPIQSEYLWAYFKVLGHSNVAVNPILYAYFHRKVRKQAVLYFGQVTSVFRRKNATRKKNGVESISGNGGQVGNERKPLSSASESKDDPAEVVRIKTSFAATQPTVGTVVQEGLIEMCNMSTSTTDLNALQVSPPNEIETSTVN